MNNSIEELTGVAFWTFLLAIFSMGVLLAVVLTWPVCSLLLALYRRSVTAGMRRATSPPSAPAGSAPGAPAHAGSAPTVTIVEVRPGPPTALIARAHDGTRRATAVFVVAGTLFGLGSSATYHLVADIEWEPVRFLLLTLVLAWLVVPTAISTGITGGRSTAALWVGYVATVVVLVSLRGGPDLMETLGYGLLVVVLPGLFVLATAARTLRGAAWFVAPAVVVLVLAAAAAYPPLLFLWYGLAFNRLAWTLTAAAVGLLALIALYGATVTVLYERKWASDETLLVLQWWFVLALTQAMLLGTQGPTVALLAFGPFAAMVIFLLVVALVRRPLSAPRPARLLLLRTFGDQRRSSRLLRDLTVHWRWVGSVELIIGTDLATEVLEPHEFLDFLRGRLQQRFVRDRSDLERRLVELDLLPDLDGRYRVNEMLCHDDTWRPTVAALVGEVDAVLIDLRGLTPLNTGVVYELERLVASLPLDRVVAVSDATTDQGVLRWALDRAAAMAPPDSPLYSGSNPELRTVRLSGRRWPDLALVLHAVGAAAAGRSINDHLGILDGVPELASGDDSAPE